MPLFDEWCDNEEEANQKKRLWKLTEKDEGRSAILDGLADTVRSHYDSLDRIADDVEELGYDGASAILRERLPRGKKARSGDLGEILASELTEENSALRCRSGACDSRTGVRSHYAATISSAFPTTKKEMDCVS